MLYLLEAAVFRPFLLNTVDQTRQQAVFCGRPSSAEKQRAILKQAAASCSESSLPTSNAAQHSRGTVSCQRRVVVVGGCGGSEDQSWKHQTYLPFARFAPLGTRAGLSVRNDHSSPNMSGRSGFGLSWPRTIAIWRSLIWPSTASCAAAIWSG